MKKTSLSPLPPFIPSPSAEMISVLNSCPKNLLHGLKQLNCSRQPWLWLHYFFNAHMPDRTFCNLRATKSIGRHFWTTDTPSSDWFQGSGLTNSSIGISPDFKGVRNNSRNIYNGEGFDIFFREKRGSRIIKLVYKRSKLINGNKGGGWF